MPKNIVLLLDGTSNEIKTNRSNISRLYGVLEKSEDQLVYYDPGVGTSNPDYGSVGRRMFFQFFSEKSQKFWEMMTGFGVDRNVLDAYRFLLENYDNGKRSNGNAVDRDRISIFGFSRGAYTARVLAGLIHSLGLLEKYHLNLLERAYRAYKNTNSLSERSFEEIRTYERFLRPARPSIQSLGLFDTVSSSIHWGTFGPTSLPHSFTSINTSVQTIRHAVSIDECRTMFRPQLWSSDVSFLRNRFQPNDATPQDAKEVWFAGVHGDVGGGYPESESTLAKIPLHWMIEEMKAEGLLFKTRTVNELVLGTGEDRNYTRPDPLGREHNSMNWGWAILEFLPRPKPKDSKRPSIAGVTLPLFEPRHIPEGATVHRSVVDRINGGDYAPPNLPKDYKIEG
jgi:uncharacterized protein (DUF2235 family)